MAAITIFLMVSIKKQRKVIGSNGFMTDEKHSLVCVLFFFGLGFLFRFLWDVDPFDIINDDNFVEFWVLFYMDLVYLTESLCFLSLLWIHRKSFLWVPQRHPKVTE